jgi:hypothetical protein
MKSYCVFATLTACVGACAAAGQAPPTASAVPRLVRFSGTAMDARGNPISGVAGVTFALYGEQTGGAPLWMETQNVQTGVGGHYTVLLGATKSEGLPADLFSTAQAHWVGISIEGQAEQPRVQLVSAPYAFKAGDAETLGGLPASAFLLARSAVPARVNASGTKPAAATSAAPDTACTSVTSDGTATANQVAKFAAPCAVEPSAIFESGGKVGIGTTTPAATLDVKGAATLRGALTMIAQGAATATAGAESNPVDLLAASFDSTTDTSITQHFRWQAEAAGNDTANPSGTLNLLYAPGSGAPAETGLSVNSKGLLTFGTGQTFPGAGTITGITAGAGLTGGGTAGNVTLGLTTACASGQTLQWNGSAWTCKTVGAGTITGVTAGVGLGGGGTSGSVTLSNTGVLALTGGAGISSSGGNSPVVSLNTSYTDGRYLQVAGGSMSGALNLPANGLTAAGNQLVLAGGSVGIGTPTPGAPLEVAGNMKISGAASVLTFPDGTTQATVATPVGVAGVNPLQVALLQWFPAYQSSATFGVGSRPVGIAFDGSDIWVANSNSNTVTKVMAATGTVLGTYNVGTQPQYIAFDGANVWVTNYNSNNVTKLAAATGALVGTYSVGKSPNGIAFDGANIWVANLAGNNVTKLAASSGAVLGTFAVGTYPTAIAYDGANIWVANSADGTVTKLAASNGAVLGTYTVGTNPVGVAFDGANIWVTNSSFNSTVTKLLASTGAVLGTFYPLGENPSGIAFDGVNIWVANENSNSVTKFLASTGAVLGKFNTGDSPIGVAFDGADIWVTNWLDGTVSKL